jgi:hypothetical protein
MPSPPGRRPDIDPLDLDPGMCIEVLRLQRKTDDKFGIVSLFA